jgi:hypothetical protein
LCRTAIDGLRRRCIAAENIPSCYGALQNDPVQAFVEGGRRSPTTLAEAQQEPEIWHRSRRLLSKTA